MRIVFMGTPEFAVPSLEMLINEGYSVEAVVTQPDRPKGRGNRLAAPPVKECALKAGIRVLQPEKVKTAEFLEELQAIAPDLVVTAAYGRILPKPVLDVPPLGCINVHGSLLPKYRGAAPIQWAVINGEKVTGVTTMYMDVGLDTGDMLVREEIGIAPDITAGELYDKLAAVGAQVLKETLVRLQEGTLARVPQQEAEATHAPLLRKETGLIDWTKPAEEVHNLVRGTNPWPGAQTLYKGERLRIWKTCIFDETCSAEKPGSIFKVCRDGIAVACGKGAVAILDLQFDSSKRVNVQDCWHNIDEGEVLG